MSNSRALPRLVPGDRRAGAAWNTGGLLGAGVVGAGLVHLLTTEYSPLSTGTAGHLYIDDVTAPRRKSQRGGASHQSQGEDDE